MFGTHLLHICSGGALVRGMSRNRRERVRLAPSTRALLPVSPSIRVAPPMPPSLSVVSLPPNPRVPPLRFSEVTQHLPSGLSFMQQHLPVRPYLRPLHIVPPPMPLATSEPLMRRDVSPHPVVRSSLDVSSQQRVARPDYQILRRDPHPLATEAHVQERVTAFLDRWDKAQPARPLPPLRPRSQAS